MARRGRKTALEASGESLGPTDLILDRVGPDPYDPRNLGGIVTVGWSARIGSTTGTVRLWLPESILGDVLTREPALIRTVPAGIHAREYVSMWQAEAGFVSLPRGLSRLRRGGVLPLAESRLGGTPASPTGPISLVCVLSGSGERLVFCAEPVPGSGGRRVRLTSALDRQFCPRQPLNLGSNTAMNANPPHPAEPGPAVASASASEAQAPDIPVTLTVELGRVNLTLGRLADLKPGDVIELGRHSREPVELTSNGRLIARGELVLIDTELGVRVTHVFL